MDMKSTREAYIDRLKGQLDELNEAIDTLEKKGAKATGAARERFDEKVHELGELREDMQTNLDRLKIATEDSWQEIRESLDNTLDQISEIARDSLRRVMDFLK